MKLAETAPRFEIEKLRQAICQEYRDVALNPTKGFHFAVGRPLAERLGYSSAMLEGIPTGAVESFAGVGNPFELGPINGGEVVVDVGSGAGMDALIASRLVGPSGRVIGVDMTDEMRVIAAQNASAANANNVEFMRGLAEDLPLPDSSANVVISNGVINLCPDKRQAFREIDRVLRSGGRLQIADILLEEPVPGTNKDLIYLWAECVAGGLLESEYVEIMHVIGFRDVEVVSSFDVFKGSPGEEAAARYGARGFNIRGVKP